MTMPDALSPPIGADSPWLAPLAGYSDLPFRLLCREHGAAVACTEMVSAKGLLYASPGTETLLRTTPEDAPLVVQLFGSEPEPLAEAVTLCRERGFTWFDLNAGCPVPKVVKTGAGAGLVRTPSDRARLGRIVAAMAEAAGPGRLGVKFRPGFNAADAADPATALETMRRCEDAGAAWLTLHPRSAKQGYAGEADWSAIARMVGAAAVPVMASGDLFTADAARECLRRTGCAGVMFARGALRNPLIFRELRTGEGLAGRREAAAALIERHVALALAHGGGRRELLRMRTFAPRYVRGLPDAGALRKRFIACECWDDVSAVAQSLHEPPIPPTQSPCPNAQDTDT